MWSVTDCMIHGGCSYRQAVQDSARIIAIVVLDKETLHVRSRRYSLYKILAEEEVLRNLISFEIGNHRQSPRSNES